MATSVNNQKIVILDAISRRYGILGNAAIRPRCGTAILSSVLEGFGNATESNTGPDTDSAAIITPDKITTPTVCHDTAVFQRTSSTNLHGHGDIQFGAPTVQPTAPAIQHSALLAGQVCNTPPALSGLENSPLELLHQIVSHLDIQSVLRMLDTSRTLIRAVQSYPGMERILKSKKLSRAFFTLIESSPSFRTYNISDFVQLITTPECGTCHGSDPDFAPFVSLLSLKRMCVPCSQRPGCLAIPAGPGLEMVGLDASEVHVLGLGKPIKLKNICIKRGSGLEANGIRAEESSSEFHALVSEVYKAEDLFRAALQKAKSRNSDEYSDNARHGLLSELAYFLAYIFL